MIEVEVKVRASLDEAEESLTQLDAQEVGEKRQVDTYFSAPHRDFAQTDEALRVRRENGDAYVTYKGAKRGDGTKTRQEHETSVGDAQTARAVLESLGFEEFGTVEKDRRLYVLDGTTVTLDEVDGLGEFVEVELEREEGDDNDEAREAVFGTLERLDLDPQDSVTESYLELLYA
ncbi:class IV adenylate cyclase [Haladaptatus sp. F3-133]|uniref:Class IV adenylate cyclase n=1 Tax=Halorutilus salinus TaxID=2487751 RepID=A0A9Q4C4J7_9EURY|nr:class IV adenylate cyclase [Halorutilus salinus]MCX2818334.1 class IV adenylate cyclase [Halorutilus salinus]